MLQDIATIKPLSHALLVEPRPRTPRKDWCRASLPLGTIRVHGVSRRIKVSMGEPKSRQWMDYARWWWITNRGPVPEGKRVCHKDGDKLNDAPSNYELMTPGDVIFLWHDRNPAGSKRNYEKAARATAEMNRRRGLITRASRLLPNYWYAVDMSRELIVNQPQRERWQVLHAAGVPVENWRTAIAAALGWPEVGSSGAFILAALAEKDWTLNRGVLLTSCRDLRTLWGCQRPLTRGALWQAIRALPAGWVRTHRQPGRRSPFYRITSDALAARGWVCPFIPKRGSELSWPPFHRFERVEDFDSIGRVVRGAAHHTPREPLLFSRRGRG